MIDNVSTNTELLNNVKKQIEYYFSDINYCKDKFLLKSINESTDKSLSIDILFKFNKLKSLTMDKSVILEAIKESELVEINEKKDGLRRMSPPVSISMEDIRKRTVVMSQISFESFDQVTPEYIQELLHNFEGIERVLIHRHFKKDILNPKCKKEINLLSYFGYVSITFKTMDQAKKLESCDLDTWKKLCNSKNETLLNYKPLVINAHEYDSKDSLDHFKSRFVGAIKIKNIPLYDFHYKSFIQNVKSVVNHKQFTQILFPFQSVNDNQCLYVFVLDMLNKDNIYITLLENSLKINTKIGVELLDDSSFNEICEKYHQKMNKNKKTTRNYNNNNKLAIKIENFDVRDQNSLKLKINQIVDSSFRIISFQFFKNVAKLILNNDTEIESFMKKIKDMNEEIMINNNKLIFSIIQKHEKIKENNFVIQLEGAKEGMKIQNILSFRQQIDHLISDDIKDTSDDTDLKSENISTMKQLNEIKVIDKNFYVMQLSSRPNFVFIKFYNEKDAKKFQDLFIKNKDFTIKVPFIAKRINEKDNSTIISNNNDKEEAKIETETIKENENKKEDENENEKENKKENDEIESEAEIILTLSNAILLNKNDTIMEEIAESDRYSNTRSHSTQNNYKKRQWNNNKKYNSYKKQRKY